MSETKPKSSLSNKNSETVTQRPFEIQGADGEIVAIPPGEFYFNSKARGRRMMLNSLSSEARRVYASLELGTMGFQQELAVVMDGKRRDLTPADICRQTGLSKQHTRRGLVELEDAGLAERRSDDGGPLRNGHMRLYSWAIPRKAGNKKGSHARLPFPDWFPESWEPFKLLITRLRLSFSIDEVAARSYLTEGEEIARSYQKAEKVALEFLERVCAQPKKAALNKEERTEITSERKGSSSSEQGAHRTTTPPPVENHGLIREALSNYGTPDGEIVRTLVKACRKNHPNATDEEIAHFIHDKAPLARNGNKFGFLLKAVPKCFEGDYAAPPVLLTGPKKAERKQSYLESEIEKELAKAAGGGHAG